MSIVLGQLLFWLGVVVAFRFGIPLLTGVAWMPVWAALITCYFAGALIGVFFVSGYLLISPDARYLTEEKVGGLGDTWGVSDCLGPYLMMGAVGLIAGLAGVLFSLGTWFLDRLLGKQILASISDGLQVTCSLLLLTSIGYFLLRTIREERSGRKPARKARRHTPHVAASKDDQLRGRKGTGDAKVEPVRLEPAQRYGQWTKKEAEEAPQERRPDNPDYPDGIANKGRQ